MALTLFCSKASETSHFQDKRPLPLMMCLGRGALFRESMSRCRSADPLQTGWSYFDFVRSERRARRKGCGLCKWDLLVAVLSDHAVGRASGMNGHEITATRERAACAFPKTILCTHATFKKKFGVSLYTWSLVAAEQSDVEFCEASGRWGWRRGWRRAWALWGREGDYGKALRLFVPHLVRYHRAHVLSKQFELFDNAYVAGKL